jgi:hypothetical protein
MSFKKIVSVFTPPNDVKTLSCHLKKIISVLTHPNDEKTRHFCRYATKIIVWHKKILNVNLSIFCVF